MKDNVRVSVVQFASEWLEREKNAQRMRTFVEQEAQKGAELIVFPELANIGFITPIFPGEPPYFDSKTTALDFAVKYIKASEPIPGPTTEVLGEVARKRGVYIAVGISQLHPVIPGTLYNSAALIGPSGVIGVHHKMHLGVDEKHFFYPGNTSEVYATDLGNIGMIICYDSRFPELSRILALKGAEIICSVVAVPQTGLRYHGGSTDQLKCRSSMRALENFVYYLTCNRSGKEGNTSYVGHSAVAAPSGQLLACSESDEEEVITAELSNDKLIEARVPLTVFQDRRPELYSLISEPLSKPYRPTAVMKPAIEPTPAAPETQLEGSEG